MRAVALDLGASGGKILSGYFDGERMTVREIHRFGNEPIDTGGHLYWDIQRIYANLLEGLRKAAEEGFTSFGVDSFSNDFGLLDIQGHLIGQVYSYRDSRTEGLLEWMDQILPAREVYERTGNQRARFNTLVQLVAQARSSERSLLENARHLLFVPDLLDYFLCGEKGAEYTIASVSQLYNRAENQWDGRILDSFGIPAGILPGVIPPALEIGEATAEVLQLSGARPFSICTVGHHDTASAVGVVPSRDEHIGYISSGTWSLLGTETQDVIVTDGAYKNNFANEGGVGGRNRFLKNIMGLWLLQECRREFGSVGIVDTFEELDLEAEKASPFRSVIDPDDPDFFQPGGMIGKIQSQCRKSREPVPETPGEITRCIQESLALAYRATLQKLEELAGLDIPSVHIVGGGARSRFLNQFAACSMKRPVFAGPYEAAAIGNLCAQFIAAGELRDWNEARQAVAASFRIREFLPQDAPRWDEAFERYLRTKNYPRE